MNQKLDALVEQASPGRGYLKSRGDLKSRLPAPERRDVRAKTGSSAVQACDSIVPDLGLHVKDSGQKAPLRSTTSASLWTSGKSSTKESSPMSGLELVLSPPTPRSRTATRSLTGYLTQKSATTVGSSAVVPGPAWRGAASSDSLQPGVSAETVAATRSSPVEDKDVEHAELLLTLQRRRGNHTQSELAWNFLENPESSFAARVLAGLTPILLLGTVFMTLEQSRAGSYLHGRLAAALETTIDGIFLLECLVRFICCPNRKVFFFDIYNIIDILAAMPLAIRACIGFVLPRGEVVNVPHGILLCAVPIIRLLKTLRRFEKFHLILNAFRLAAEALPVLLFILSLIALVFAMLIYLVEPRSNVVSIPMSLWLTIVTMSTVGYGDMTPQSTMGHMITGILIVITALYMSIPLGIVGNAFTTTWEQRDRILLMQRTRERLRQWGFGASDIPALFRLSGPTTDGCLTVSEFRTLLTRMHVGFSEERILKLFESFDDDRDGVICDREFVRQLFPSSYHEVYRDNEEESPESTRAPTGESQKEA